MNKSDIVYNEVIKRLDKHLEKIKHPYIRKVYTFKFARTVCGELGFYHPSTFKAVVNRLDTDETYQANLDTDYFNSSMTFNDCWHWNEYPIIEKNLHYITKLAKQYLAVFPVYRVNPDARNFIEIKVFTDAYRKLTNKDVNQDFINEFKKEKETFGTYHLESLLILAYKNEP